MPLSSLQQQGFSVVGPFGVAVLATPDLSEATFIAFSAELREGQWAFNLTTDLSRCACKH